MRKFHSLILYIHTTGILAINHKQLFCGFLVSYPLYPGVNTCAHEPKVEDPCKCLYSQEYERMLHRQWRLSLCFVHFQMLSSCCVNIN